MQERVAEVASWAGAVGIRHVTVYDAEGSVKGAARQLFKKGAGTMALVAEAKYDAKAKKFTSSEIEDRFKLGAPGVYTSSDGTNWAPCKTSHSQNSVSVDDVKSKLAACAAGKVEL